MLMYLFCFTTLLSSIWITLYDYEFKGCVIMASHAVSDRIAILNLQERIQSVRL